MSDEEIFEGNYISILQVPMENLAKNSLRPVIIDEENGISAFTGKLKYKSQEVVHSYLFNKDKWNLEEANQWVEEYRKGKNSLFYTPLMQTILTEMSQFREELKQYREFFGTKKSHVVNNRQGLKLKNQFIDDVYVIRGIAIKEGTFNGVFYSGTELMKAFQTLKDKPFTVDHVESVMAAVGKITDVSYNPETREVLFEAEIRKPEIITLLEENIIDGVSVEVMGMLDFDDDNGLFITDLEFTALSLVLTPACSECRIQNKGFESEVGDIMTAKNSSDVDSTEAVEQKLSQEPCTCKSNCGCGNTAMYEEDTQKLSKAEGEAPKPEVDAEPAEDEANAETPTESISYVTMEQLESFEKHLMDNITDLLTEKFELAGARRIPRPEPEEDKPEAAPEPAAEPEAEEEPKDEEPAAEEEASAEEPDGEEPEAEEEPEEEPAAEEPEAEEEATSELSEELTAALSENEKITAELEAVRAKLEKANKMERISKILSLEESSTNEDKRIAELMKNSVETLDGMIKGLLSAKKETPRSHGKGRASATEDSKPKGTAFQLMQARIGRI